MKPWRLATLLFLVSWAQPAQSSPATDLYRAAVNTVQENYFGWSNQNFSLLVGEYVSKLEERCQTSGAACSYDTGRQVLTELFDAFGDAHTYVRDPESAERLREVNEDRAVSRTGLQVIRMEGGLLVVAVMPGSPAGQAGLKRFDLLLTVNGQQAGKRQGKDAPIGPKDFIRLERQGEPLKLLVRRAGGPERTLNLSPAILKARDEPTLSWTGADQKVAVIQYPSFLAQDSAQLFLKRVNEAKDAGARALIVDLRFNGGGSLNQCVAAASIYGPVVYRTRYRVGGFTFTGLAGEQGKYLDTLFGQKNQKVWTLPSAVLVGPNTASCAEVFSFYAQRSGVSIVGETTKGVGNSGVTFHSLPDGGVIAVTMLRSFDQQDQPLPAQIQPTVPAPTDLKTLVESGRDTALETALSTLASATKP